MYKISLLFLDYLILLFARFHFILKNNPALVLNENSIKGVLYSVALRHTISKKKSQHKKISQSAVFITASHEVL